MKTYIVLIVLSLTCGSYAASVKALRELITPKSDAAMQICGNDYGFKCFECSTMLTCLGPTMAPVQTPCPSDKPYCDTTLNICTSLPPVGQDCDVPYTKTYLCMTSPDGFYPHPYDCERFFECYKGELYEHSCSPGYVWSTKGMACKRLTSYSQDCGLIQCTDEGDAPLSNNPNFFGICPQNGNMIEILVQKCEGIKVYRQESGCIFECPSEGLFPMSDNSPTYIRCYTNGHELVYDLLECHGDRIFDADKKVCVERS